MKIRLVGPHKELMHETELNGPPPGAILWSSGNQATDLLFTRIGIADGVASYQLTFYERITS